MLKLIYFAVYSLIVLIAAKILKDLFTKKNKK